MNCVTLKQNTVHVAPLFTTEPETELDENCSDHSGILTHRTRFIFFYFFFFFNLGGPLKAFVNWSKGLTDSEM